MKLNPKYLIYHDLIGVDAYAQNTSKSKSREFKDIGTVIDDTRNMLITNQDKVVKKYIKKDYIFRFILPKNDKNQEEKYFLEVEGRRIVGRPENRLRNLRRKRWVR